MKGCQVGYWGPSSAASEVVIFSLLQSCNKKKFWLEQFCSHFTEAPVAQLCETGLINFVPAAASWPVLSRMLCPIGTPRDEW